MSSTPPGTPAGSTPAGWYPDTNQPGTLRYWDGNAWTEHTHAGQAGGQTGVQGGTGYQTYAPGMTNPPSNHLVPAILTTIFCCLPFGIVSIVKAAQVNNLWASGQYDAARKSSADAKKWWMVSIGVSVGLMLVYFLLVVAIGVGSTTAY